MPTDKKRSPLGRKIAIARAKRGWRQVDLARAARVSPTTIATIETGEVSQPYLTTLVRLARALELDIEELAELAEEQGES